MAPDPAPGGTGRPWLSLYDDDVPADVDVEDSPFCELLDDAAEHWPGSAAICYLGREISYRELRHEAELLSTCLARLGVNRGDRVALVLPNCPQLVIGMHAVLRLGAVAVPLNPSWSQEYLAAALTDSGAEVVVCIDRVFEAIGAARDDPGIVLREIVVTLAADYLPALDRLTLSVPSRSARRERARASGTIPPGAGVRMWTEELRRARGRPVPAPGKADGVVPGVDPAVLVYPTAGAPDPARLRGTLLTSCNLRAAGAQDVAWLPHARPGREVMLVGLPLFTAEAITLCLAAGTLLGAALLLVARGPGEPTTMRDGARPTLLAASPSFLAELAEDTEAAHLDLRSVRVCVTGPEPLAPDLVGRYEKLIGGRLVDGLSVPGAVNVLGNPVRSGHRTPAPAGQSSEESVPQYRHGIPLPSTEIRVLDPDGVPLPIGRSGRLAVRGPQVFSGFWRHPDETARVLHDGWLWTDVEVRLHEDGWVELLSRH